MNHHNSALPVVEVWNVRYRSDAGLVSAYDRDKLLRLPGGSPLRNERREVLEHALNELFARGPVHRHDDGSLCLPREFSWLDVLLARTELSRDETIRTEKLVDFATRDRALHLPMASGFDHAARRQPLSKLPLWNLSDDDRIGRIVEQVSAAPFDYYVACVILADNGGSLTWAHALASQFCTPTEYAAGVVAEGMAALPDPSELPLSTFQNEFELRQREACICSAFLWHSVPDTTRLICAGESAVLEFKSTMRLNLHTGNPDQKIALSVLKTIAAFLNSGGGTLMIGVNDSGQPVEDLIAKDGFKNEDRFLLHLINLIGSSMGRSALHLVDANFRTLGDHKICVVACSPSPRPVFVSVKGDEERLYVRTGPSTQALCISEALAYVSDRFP